VPPEHTTVSPSIPPEEDPSHGLKILLIVLIVVLVVVGIFLGIGLLNSEPKEATNVATPEILNETLDEEEQPKTLPTIIYQTHISEQHTAYRTWPTIQIHKKVDDRESEVIATVGDVDEYPIAFAISRDRRYLAINLETKLQVLDLETKELHTFIDLEGSEKRIVGSPAFSPDNLNVAFIIYEVSFIRNTGTEEWDYDARTEVSELYSMNIETFKPDLLTKQVRISTKELSEGGLPINDIFVWRSDNKIIVDYVVGKDGEKQPGYYYIDVTKPGEIEELRFTPGKGNENAFLGIAYASSTHAAVCGDIGGYGGGSPVYLRSVITIVDAITNQQIDSIGAVGTHTEIVAFSPDNTQVLYKVMELPETFSECGNDNFGVKNPRYYLKTFGKEPAQITDYQDILANWKTNTINAVIMRTEDVDPNLIETLGIVVDGNILVREPYDKQLSIIAQYYK
jgi:hypothetical protein